MFSFFFNLFTGVYCANSTSICMDEMLAIIKKEKKEINFIFNDLCVSASTVRIYTSSNDDNSHHEEHLLITVQTSN